MKTTGESLKQGACAALEVAARRGSAALEAAWQRFTPKHRALVPTQFIETLRREAAATEKQPL